MLPLVEVTFFDLDESKALVIDGYDQFIVVDSTRLVITSEADGRTRFAAGAAADYESIATYNIENPRDPSTPTAITDEQRRNAVSFTFEGRSSFRASLRVMDAPTGETSKKDRAAEGEEGEEGVRKFLFAGESFRLPFCASPPHGCA